jgi:hypothetical protein
MSAPTYSNGKSNNNNNNNGTYDDGTTMDGGGGGSGTDTTYNSSTTQITLQLNTDMTAAQRFPVWILLCVSSIICVIALQSRRGLLDVDGAGDVWIVSVGAISFLLSLSAVIMYLCFRTIFVSNIPEAVMVRGIM